MKHAKAAENLDIFKPVLFNKSDLYSAPNPLRALAQRPNASEPVHQSSDTFASASCSHSQVPSPGAGPWVPTPPASAKPARNTSTLRFNDAQSHTIKSFFKAASALDNNAFFQSIIRFKNQIEYQDFLSVTGAATSLIKITKEKKQDIAYAIDLFLGLNSSPLSSFGMFPACHDSSIPQTEKQEVLQEALKLYGLAIAFNLENSSVRDLLSGICVASGIPRGTAIPLDTLVSIFIKPRCV